MPSWSILCAKKADKSGFRACSGRGNCRIQSNDCSSQWMPSPTDFSLLSSWKTSCCCRTTLSCNTQPQSPSFSPPTTPFTPSSANSNDTLHSSKAPISKSSPPTSSSPSLNKCPNSAQQPSSSSAPTETLKAASGKTKKISQRSPKAKISAINLWIACWTPSPTKVCRLSSKRSSENWPGTANAFMND
jgi:hypothetical protein